MAVEALSSPASLYMCLIISEVNGWATKWLAATILCLSMVKNLHVPVPLGIYACDCADGHRVGAVLACNVVHAAKSRWQSRMASADRL